MIFSLLYYTFMLIKCQGFYTYEGYHFVVVASYVIVNVLLTTAVDARAIFPAVVVVNVPVGIKMI